MKNLFSYSLFFTLALCAFAETDDQVLSAILKHADEMHLSDAPQWKALLHYDRTHYALSPSSRAKAGGFFLSPNGGDDSAAELDATVRAFFSTATKNDDHPICLYPARFAWLTEQLHIPQSTFQTQNCSNFNEWFAAIAPKTVTMIFPASFLNNPASAFGHTFLRFDQEGQTEETRLLAYGADFAAATQGEDALSYAVKGVFGGYDGFYSIGPYYKKVIKYTDLENRDIWEYQLSLSPEEVHRLVLHLWELRRVPFSYYYFDENCSYHILSLLDVARPSLNLVDSFRWWVMPVDTIRELFLREGLVSQTVFRPSAATKLRHRIAQTSDDAQIEALRLSDSKSDTNVQVNLTDQEKAAAYDLAYDVHTYERIKKRDDADQTKQKAWELLAKRSALPKHTIPELVPPTIRPDQGHKTVKLTTGIGTDDAHLVSRTTFRPAFHSLSDPEGGYIKGSQIKFFESEIKAEPGDGFTYDRFTALDITSLTPRDRFFHPLSWRVNLEAVRKETSPQRYPLLTSFSVGAGRTYALSDTILVYGLLDGASELSGKLDDEYAIGAGPRIGLIDAHTDRIATEAMLYAHRYMIGDSHSEIHAALSERISLSDDVAIRFEVMRDHLFSTNEWTGMVRFELFVSP